MTPEVAPGHYLVKYEGFAPHLALQVAQRSLVQQFRVTNELGGVVCQDIMRHKKSPGDNAPRGSTQSILCTGPAVPKEPGNFIGYSQTRGGERGAERPLFSGEAGGRRTLGILETARTAIDPALPA